MTLKSLGWRQWALIAFVLPLFMFSVFQKMSSDAYEREQRRIECEEDRKNPEPFEYGDELLQFFPPNYRFSVSECDSSFNNRKISTLGAALYSADEPPIWPNRGFNREKRHFIARIAILPWRGQSHIFRAEVQGKTVILTGKRMSGQGGMNYGEVELEKTITLSNQQSRRFLKALRRVQSPPFWENIEFIRMESLDGTSIYLETNDTDGYQAFSESEGQSDALDEFAALCFELMEWNPHPT